MSIKSNKKGSQVRNGQRGFFDKEVIKEIVLTIESGTPRREIIKHYGMSRSTLSDWMREHGSPGYQVSKRGHLSVVDRRSMIRAIQEGRMTIGEAKIAYNISLISTVKKWLRDAEREKSELVGLKETFMDEPADKQQEASERSNKVLQQALEEAELKIKALNTLIDVAEERLKISIRKNFGAKQS
jgi:transposase